MVAGPSELVKATSSRGPVVLNGAVVMVPVPFCLVVWSMASGGGVIWSATGADVEPVKADEDGVKTAIRECEPSVSELVAYVAVPLSDSHR